MHVEVTRLEYWKTEHTLETNEDACHYQSETGRFVVADGVGTASFSNVWSNVLVQRFVEEDPLASVDPFEVQWWLRPAQRQFDRFLVGQTNLSSIYRQKALEGSQSTLASLCVTKIHDSGGVARLLVFGDSCVFVQKHGESGLASFYYTKPKQFDLPPICLPSNPKVYDRTFHAGHVHHIVLEPGMVIILATDAVSRWILTSGSGRLSSPGAACEQVAKQTNAEMWQQFIDDCRFRYEMIDDDCDALVLRLIADDAERGAPLGTSPASSEEAISSRRAELELCRQLDDPEELAVVLGDGQWLESGSYDEAEMHRCRDFADAKQAVIRSFREAVNFNSESKQKVKVAVEPVWNKYAHILRNEPSVAPLRNSLRQYGVEIDARSTLAAPQETAYELFKEALSSDDDRRIIDEYDSLMLDDYPIVQPTERRRLQLALVREAIQEDNDEGISENYQDELRHSFSRQERERIGLAQERWAARRVLLESLAIGGESAIVLAYERASLYGKLQITPTEELLVTRAKEKLEAFKSLEKALGLYNDEAIASAYNPILDESSLLTPAQRADVDLALKRSVTIPQFRRAIADDNDQDIVNHYGMELVGSTLITEDEHWRALQAQMRQGQAKDFRSILRRYEGLATEEADKAIAACYEGLAKEILTRNKPVCLSESDHERARLASDRLRVLNRLRMAQEDGDQRMVVKTFEDNQLLLESSETFRVDLRGLVNEASIQIILGELTEAIDSDDDQRIAEAFDPKLLGYGLESNQQARVTLALKRTEATRRLRYSLQNEPPPSILRACDSVADLAYGFRNLSPKECERLFNAIQKQLDIWRVKRTLASAKDVVNDEPPIKPHKPNSDAELLYFPDLTDESLDTDWYLTKEELEEYKAIAKKSRRKSSLLERFTRHSADPDDTDRTEKPTT